MDPETRLEALEVQSRVMADAIRQLAVTNEVQARLIAFLLLHDVEAAGRLKLLMDCDIMLAAPVPDEVLAGFEHFYQMVKPALEARRALEEEGA